ncbi:MAG: tyrosine protein phosphatase [Alphaproteobacteria bacterium]|nr:tyrosine protein phosphatase [Alphaproteobacteria bacterium]
MIYISSWRTMQDRAVELGVTHILSLLGIEGAPDTPLGIDPARHLHIEVDDYPASFAGDIVPTMEHVTELLDFATAWDRQGPMLVHCYAGVSRSTAAALIILCQYNPGREMEAALALRWAAPHAKPNLRMIAIADQLLKCDGNLIDAVEAMGPGSYAGGQTPLVELPLSL